MRTEIDWSTVKAGDKLAADFRAAGYSVLTVEKVTATQIVTQHGQRWRRSDGHSIGRGSYDGTWLEPLTDDIKRGIEARKARNWLLNMAVKDWSDDRAIAVRAAVEALLKDTP